MGMRNSWLKNLPQNVLYQFIIGSTNNKTIDELIEIEDEEYGDIIISTLHETYSNLTLKTYSIFQWTQKYCPKAKYLLKTDDDTVVDVKRMQYWIENNYNKIRRIFDGKVIFCKVWTNSTPFRDPEHKCGPTYLLTAEAIPSILKEAPKHYFITTEDVFFTGIVSQDARVYRFQKANEFGSGPEIIGNSTMRRCDVKGVPYLTSIYGISFNGTFYEEGGNNPFKNATDQLLSLSC
uniref:Hexosyltransferase n=1 Tax=Panagrolaimus sp. ES5 TaxID=591445 RepID=A0AC34F1L3_9BILA